MYVSIWTNDKIVAFQTVWDQIIKLRHIGLTYLCVLKKNQPSSIETQTKGVCEE